MVITSTIAAGVAMTLASAATVGYTAYEGIKAIGDWLKPDVPKAPLPQPALSVESEGIRRAAMKEESRTQQLQKLYATRGNRVEDTMLGGYRQTLG